MATSSRSTIRTRPAGQDKTAYWDSSEVDANALPLYPGEYHHFQWIFTDPGTYEISVQLKGHVRKDAPSGADADWAPISENRVETSVVEQYVFNIGPLTLNHEPSFYVEAVRGGTFRRRNASGRPEIKVRQEDDDALTFELKGPGHSLFSVENSNGNAQIKVAGNLDYEAFSEASPRGPRGILAHSKRQGQQEP